MDKKEMRKEILSKRSQLDSRLRAEKSDQIVRMFLNTHDYQRANYLFSFIPFRDEPDIRGILNAAMQEGKKVAVPKTLPEQKRLIPYLLTGWDELQTGHFGILEPDEERAKKAELEKIDLILIPGVAFDKRGGRLGYGGGYYDRFLSRLSPLPKLVALCFSEQFVNEVPMDKHDYRVDAVVTEQGWIDCTNSF